MNKLSSKQLQILAFPYTSYDALICDGAIRSGKTSIMTVAFVDWAMRNFNSCNFAICGKTVGSAVKNIIKPYLALAYAKKRYKMTFNRSDNVVTVKSADRENYFYIYGGKDESSYALIQGITLAGVLLDEVALMVRSFVEQAMARCSVEGAKLWFNCNPENPSHWFYNEWIKEADKKNALHLHFLMTDNPSLSKETLERYERLYRGVFYKKYIKGEWVRAEGLVFEEFVNNRNRYIISKDKLPKRFKWCEMGYDIGGNKSAYGLTATAQGFDDVIYVLRSRKIQARDLKTEDVENACFEFIESVERDYGVTIQNCYVDDNYYTLVNDMNDRRYMFDVASKIKNSMPLWDRPLKLTLLMGSDKFKIVDNECKALCDELEEAVFDEKSDKAIILDDGSTQIDAIDSLWYSMATWWHYL